MGREMPLSRGRQQPTSERRKGDRMSGLTQWEVTCGGWTEAAHSRASGPARVSAPYVPICSVLSEAHDGFSTKHRHVGLFPRKWTHLEIFISTWNGPSKYPPHQLLPTGQMFLQIQGPVRWPSRPVHRAVICEAAKDKKPPRDH